MSVPSRLLLVLSVAYSLWRLAVHNLGYTGVWYDEAVQFWVSRGLGPFADPNVPRGGLADVVRWNSIANLDPGGFSAILYYWSSLDTGLVWLRLLPYLWFLASLVLLALLAWRLTASMSLSLLAAALPLAYPSFLYFATEIRAYSMEAAGVLAGAYWLDRAIHQPGSFASLALGMVCAFFLGSRYSFVLVTAAIATVFLLHTWRRLRAGSATGWRDAAEFLVPLMAGAAIIYGLTLTTQIDIWLQGSVVAHGAPDYVKAHVLGRLDLSGALALVAVNTLSPAALPITTASLLCLLLILARNARPDRWWVIALHSGDRFRHLYGLSAICLLLSALVSAAGAYPWNIDTRWSFYLVAVSAVSVVALVAHATSALRALHKQNRLRDNRIVGAVRATVPGIALGVVLVVCYRAANFRQHFYPDLGPSLAYLNSLVLPRHSVLVWGYETPVVRYLYEAGPFRNHPHYPSAFQFHAWSPRSDNDCLMYAVNPARPDVAVPTLENVVLKVHEKEPVALRTVEYTDAELHRRLCRHILTQAAH
jgi:hypothetical protein